MPRRMTMTDLVKLKDSQERAAAGRQERRVPLAQIVPEEHDEQVVVIEWARLNAYRCPALALLHAIPNGGNRGTREAGRLKAEGVLPGVCDLFLPHARWRWIDERVLSMCSHGLYVEMKRVGAPPSAVSADQQAFIDAVKLENYQAVVCRGASEAIADISDYLEIDP